jgi:hypothetical protein
MNGWGPDLTTDVKRLQEEVSRAGARTRDGILTAVKDVVSADAVLARLFDRTVWGRIVWRHKSVGRPLSSTMAQAFFIKHQYEYVKGSVGPDGKPIGEIVVEDGPTPWVWDGPQDDEYSRVSYMLFGQYPWANAIQVSLNAAVGWGLATPPRLRPQRAIRYPGSLTHVGDAAVFFVNKTGITPLDDIEVIRLFG